LQGAQSSTRGSNLPTTSSSRRPSPSPSPSRNRHSLPSRSRRRSGSPQRGSRGRQRLCSLLRRLERRRRLGSLDSLRSRVRSRSLLA
jgi:hypothetical protein